MSNFNVTVTGFDEIKGGIKEIIDDKSKKKEILLLLRRIAKPALLASKQFVPVQRSRSNLKSRRTVIGGSLKQSLGFITGKKGNSKENPTIYVGPRVFKGKKKEKSGRNTYGDGWYGHMVDGGHDIYRNPKKQAYVRKEGIRGRNSLARLTTKHKGSVQSRVEGQFFMKKAYQATGSTAQDEAGSAVAKYFQKRFDKKTRR
jgi:hypothetical protein